MSGDSSPQPDPKQATGTRLLWCSACGRTQVCSADDLLGYARDGWPRCCNDVMAYFVRANPEMPDDTQT
jgi:hypothetical protein